MTRLLSTLLYASIAVSACGNARTTASRAASVDTVNDSSLIAEYQQRLRDGLGSPFRLTEQLMRNTPAHADEAATLMLRQVRSGDMYRYSPVVLLVPGVSQSSAIAQQLLIRDAVVRAKHPIVGEAAINMAYHSVSASLPSGLAERVATLAALYRDYTLAYQDAWRLHTIAQRQHMKESNLLVQWRAQKRFAVEAPTMAAYDSAEARRYAELIAGGIVVALGSVSSEVARTIPAEQLDSIGRLTAMFDSARALRIFAQQDVAPDTTTAPGLKRDFGVTVRFAASVASASRARTLTDIRSALTDMRRVLPGAHFTGLRFDVRPIAKGAKYQAYHDPKARVIRIDPDAHAGTLAHELGHDLDWQIAQKRYAVAGRYATDYSIGRDRAYAYLVSNLNSSGDRPTEAFARRFEWYVAAALADRGLMNAQLTSMQNEWLTGHGWALRPDAEPLAATSFVSILADAAHLNRAQLKSAVQLVVRGPAISSRSSDSPWLTASHSTPGSAAASSLLP